MVWLESYGTSAGNKHRDDILTDARFNLASYYD